MAMSPNHQATLQWGTADTEIKSPLSRTVPVDSPSYGGDPVLILILRSAVLQVEPMYQQRSAALQVASRPTFPPTTSVPCYGSKQALPA